MSMPHVMSIGCGSAMALCWADLRYSSFKGNVFVPAGSYFSITRRFSIIISQQSPQDATPFDLDRSWRPGLLQPCISRHSRSRKFRSRVRVKLIGQITILKGTITALTDKVHSKVQKEQTKLAISSLDYS